MKKRIMLIALASALIFAIAASAETAGYGYLRDSEPIELPEEGLVPEEILRISARYANCTRMPTLVLDFEEGRALYGPIDFLDTPEEASISLELADEWKQLVLEAVSCLNAQDWGHLYDYDDIETDQTECEYIELCFELENGVVRYVQSGFTPEGKEGLPLEARLFISDLFSLIPYDAETE